MINIHSWSLVLPDLHFPLPWVGGEEEGAWRRKTKKKVHKSLQPSGFLNPNPNPAHPF